ncbi:9894_t:CDS:2 [Acaulospora colombiana]|uniref:9894_t:CDS:1 n=1 Tax=Acaulospora colombiana TaxID=27376 RepID=A0ACA9M5I8_9GLOM|nr:9894_t:CDS:2 [Acaulospora colombiana]
MEYRETIPEDSDEEIVTVTITNESTITRSDTSLPPSFVNDFDNLNIAEDRINRYSNEILSSLTSTSLNDATVINEISSLPQPPRYTPIASPIDGERISGLIRKRERAMSKALANIERSMNVDLCYVLDCTGSMAGHIAAAKDCILQVTEYIRNINPYLYGRFQANLSSVPATGGGDDPEDVLGDDYPGGDPNGLTAEIVLEKMKSEGILYSFGKITGFTDKMIEVFRSILGEIQICDLVGGDPIELINKFVKATTSSITMSISLTSALGSRTRDVYSSQERRVDIDPSVPNWNDLLAQRGVTLSYTIPRTQNELEDRRYFCKERLHSRNYYFKIAQQPFSSGVEKYAYFSIDTKRNPPRRMVMKEYFKNDSRNPFEKYLEAIEISSVASFLSIRFNSAARRKNICSINFLDVKLVRVAMNGRTRYYITEPELQGAKFKRFNVNSGLIVEHRPTLEAFVHFSYWYTDGYLVICDLQGIENTDQFLLTDPAIHCTDPLRFGRTNLGKRGIEKCFIEKHRCNDICEKLGLPRI